MTGVLDTVKTPLFGAAYYDEYMPRGLDRIDEDMRMMTDAGFNTIRIAESTWSTCEPQPGVFDFSHVDRALDAAQRHGLQVIVGTPTYAVPSWLVAMHPDVLAPTSAGEPHYGARQLMDISNAAYLFYAERVIRALIEHVSGHPAVIGYQVDNETKYYDSVSRTMQDGFIRELQREYGNDFARLNADFGLDYWSNRIDSWRDFPDVTGSINQSLRGAFDMFRRAQVARFLEWQANIVREYAREDQFVTQNFDFEWRGYSFGLQPAVDHFKAAKAVDIAGVDIYHPGEEKLTGKEIAFGGDMTRSLKDGEPYLVLETQAQGQNGWLPYPGQLRLQAFSHIASGAQAVMYWHWHSIHHSYETYWKGVLSHDLAPNPTYREAAVIGAEFADPTIQATVTGLRKHNHVAIMVSNESLDALEWFRLNTGFPDGGGDNYNDVLRRIYDALFELHVEVDFLPVDADEERLSRYSMIVTPALYCAPQSTIDRLREYVRNGGHLVSTLRSFVADEHCAVWHDAAPHGLTDVFGMTYNQFTRPENVKIDWNGTPLDGEHMAQTLMELPCADADTQVLARYDHYVWKDYPAVTRHQFGSGTAQWIATITDPELTRAILAQAVQDAGIPRPGAALPEHIAMRQGVNQRGQTVTYLLNYSGKDASLTAPVEGDVVVEPVTIHTDGTRGECEVPQLRAGSHVHLGQHIHLPAWNVVAIVMA